MNHFDSFLFPTVDVFKKVERRNNALILCKKAALQMETKKLLCCRQSLCYNSHIL